MYNLNLEAGIRVALNNIDGAKSGVYMKTEFSGVSAENIHINRLATIAKNNIVLKLLLILFIAIGLTSCISGTGLANGDHGDVNPDNNNTKTLLSIEIIPPNPVVGLGLTSQLKATAHYSDGTTTDITSQVNWYSADTSVATVNTTGLATGNQLGNTFINAKDTTTSFESRVYITVVDNIVQAGTAKGLAGSFGIVTDKSGNVYITGYTTIGLSGNHQQGKMDYFIAKYNHLGTLQWVTQMGAQSGYCYGKGISVDSLGNVYVVGYTNKGIWGQSQKGKIDYFIVKYNTDGTFQWTKQVGAPGGHTYGNGISINNSDNIYIIGSTDTPISGPLQSGDMDYFVAKYNTDGILQWTRESGAQSGGRWTAGYGISTDIAGNIYVTGTTSANLTGENADLTNYNYYIAQYTESGGLNWTRQVSTTDGNWYGAGGNGVKADNHGNVNIAGTTSGNLSGGIQHDIRDYFVAQYSSSGNLKWTRQVGIESGLTTGRAINTDDSGNIYITGATNKGLPGAVQSGEVDSFLAMYDINGNLQWTKQIGALNGYTANFGVTVDFNGHVYTTGATSVGLSQEPQQGSADYFIIKYN